jgi:hypothetical protein
MMYFYDSTGAPCCFSPDSSTLYLWNGQPAAYVQNNVVFAFGGRHLGWYSAGWLFDRQNRPALFTLDASGGPTRPTIKQSGPKAAMPKQAPMPGQQQMPAMRGAPSRTWSPVANASYFSQ